MAGVPSSHGSRGRSRHHLMHDGGRRLALRPMHITTQKKEQTLWAAPHHNVIHSWPNCRRACTPKGEGHQRAPRAGVQSCRRTSMSIRRRRTHTPKGIRRIQGRRAFRPKGIDQRPCRPHLRNGSANRAVLELVKAFGDWVGARAFCGRCVGGSRGALQSTAFSA